MIFDFNRIFVNEDIKSIKNNNGEEENVDNDDDKAGDYTMDNDDTEPEDNGENEDAETPENDDNEVEDEDDGAANYTMDTEPEDNGENEDTNTPENNNNETEGNTDDDGAANYTMDDGEEDDTTAESEDGDNEADDGAANYTMDDDEGEDTGTDNGEENSDPESDTDEGLGEEEQNEIKKLSDNIFSSLSPEEQDNRDLELKSKFKDLFDDINSINDKLNIIPKTTNNIETINNLSKMFTTLKDYIYDYMINVFDNRTYIENNMEFQKYMAFLTMGNDVIKTIKVNDEK